LALVAESLGREREPERTSRTAPSPVKNLLQRLSFSLLGELSEQVFLH
jgi:hypothetical protein